MAAVMPDKPFLTLEEIAELLSVEYQLVYRLVRRKELPAVRVGRVYRVSREDLDAYLHRSRTTTPAAPGGVCAACGTAYASGESLAYACGECAAPICFDCWVRRKVRACREHGGK